MHANCITAASPRVGLRTERQLRSGFVHGPTASFVEELLGGGEENVLRWPLSLKFVMFHSYFT